MATVFFEVSGNPLPKQSYRHGSGRGRPHTPQRIKDWQELVALRAMQAMALANLPMFEGKCGIYTLFLRSDKRRVDDGNLSKAVDDALNQVVWIDDSQVHFRMVTKGYSKDSPGIKVRVWELPDEFGKTLSPPSS
jgi:Holliday junction resolvase RusA-like endonuclease